MPWGQCKYSISSNNPGTSADNASVYGYLGNAYLLRGDTEVARRCYLEACLGDFQVLEKRYRKEKSPQTEGG